jgi:hypothetical protein
MKHIFHCFIIFLFIDQFRAQIIQDTNLPNGLMDNPSTIQAYNDNGFFIAGNEANLLTGGTKTTLVKLDSALNIQWYAVQPERLLFNPTYSHVCSDGCVLVNDTKDILEPNGIFYCSQAKLIKYKPSGDLDWAYTFNQPYWNWLGDMTEINGVIYTLWQKFLNHANSESEPEWHILKFSLNGDSLGSINITNLSPPGMFFKVYKELITTSDGQLLLSGWGQTWLPSLLSNPINQAVSVPLLQKIDLTGDLIWDYSELPEHKEVPYQAQFFNVEELPCGDIVAFGVNKNIQLHGYVIRFDADGHIQEIINPNQIWNEFYSGTSYQNCGFLAVGSIRLNNDPNNVLNGSFLYGLNDSNHEIINTSLIDYPQVIYEVINDICPLKNDSSKFAIVMTNNQSTRVVIIGAYQNELNIENNKDQAEISLSPNPSDGIFQVSSLSAEPMRIVILDQQGKQVAQFELDEISSDNSFDLSDQAPGVYFAHISQSEQWWVKKLVVR